MNRILPFLWLILFLRLTRGSEENEPDGGLEAEVEEVELPAEVYDLLQKAAWGDKSKGREERDLSDEYEVDEGSEDENNGHKGIEDEPGLFSWFGAKSGPGTATGLPGVQSFNTKKVGSLDSAAALHSSPSKQETNGGTANVVQGGQQMAYEIEAGFSQVSTPSDAEEKGLQPSVLTLNRTENSPAQVAGGSEAVAKNEGNNFEGNKDEDATRNQIVEDSLSEGTNLSHNSDDAVKELPTYVNNPPEIKEPSFQGYRFSEPQAAQFRQIYQNQPVQNIQPLKPQVQANDYQFQPLQPLLVPSKPKQLQLLSPHQQGRYVVITNDEDQSAVLPESLAPPQNGFQQFCNQKIQDNSQTQMRIEQPIEAYTHNIEPECAPPSQNIKLIGNPSCQKQLQQASMMNDLNKLDPKESENKYVINQKYTYDQALGQMGRGSPLNRPQPPNEELDAQIWRQSLESPYNIPNEQQVQPRVGISANEVSGIKEPFIQRVNSKVDAMKKKDYFLPSYPAQTAVRAVNQQVQPKVLPQKWHSKMTSNLNSHRTEQVISSQFYGSNSLNEMNRPAVIGPEKKKVRIVRDKILKVNEKQISATNSSKVTQKSSFHHSTTTAKNPLSFQHPIPPYPNDMFARCSSSLTPTPKTSSTTVTNLVDQPSETQLRAISKIRHIRDIKPVKQTVDSPGSVGSTQRPLDGKARLFFQKLQSDLLDLQNSVLSQPKMMSPIAAPENDNMKVHVKVSFEMVPKDEHESIGEHKKDDDEA